MRGPKKGGIKMNREKVFYLVLAITILALGIYVFVFVKIPELPDAHIKSNTHSPVPVVNAVGSADNIVTEKLQIAKQPENKISVTELVDKIKQQEQKIADLEKRCKTIEEELVRYHKDIWGKDPRDGKLSDYDWSIEAGIKSNSQRIWNIETHLDLKPPEGTSRYW